MEEAHAPVKSHVLTHYANMQTQTYSMWTNLRHTHADSQTLKRTYTGKQQEEEEVAAKEVGDEWALNKQHLEQEVPIGRFTWRKEVCVCVCA